MNVKAQTIVPLAHIIPDGDLDGIIVRIFKANEELERLHKDMEAADAARYLLRDAKRMAEAMKEIACDLDDLQGNSYAVHMGALRAEKEATA